MPPAHINFFSDFLRDFFFVVVISSGNLSDIIFTHTFKYFCACTRGVFVSVYSLTLLK